MATNEEIQTVPVKFLLENVYEHLSREQNILISLNIGSSPRTTILKDFTPGGINIDDCIGISSPESSFLFALV